MQVTETNAEGLKREFKVVLFAKDIEEKIDARLQEIGRSVRLPGFRPGKVPPKMLKQRFGAAVTGEVLESAVSDSANQAMAERNMRPALQPKIEIEKYEDGSDLEYTMSVELMPEIEPIDFGALELERLSITVTDEQVTDALERVAAQHKKSQPVETERKSKKGDILVIDFVGKLDGEPFPGGSAEDHHLELGSSAFVEGFEDQLIGVAPGDEVSVDITFPTEYVNDELAGRDAVFDVKVKGLREPVPVPVDDELAKMAGHEDLESLRKIVREQIAGEYANLARSRLKRALLDALAERHDFEVPVGMVDLEFDMIWKQIEEQKAQGKLDEEDAGKSDDELKAEYREIAERRVRLGLLLSEVGRRNNIEVSQDELSRAVLAEAQQHPGREREVFERYQNDAEALANLRAPVYENKVVDFILEMTKLNDRDVTPEQLMEELSSEHGHGHSHSDDSKTKAGGKKSARKKAPAKRGGKSKAAAKDDTQDDS